MQSVVTPLNWKERFEWAGIVFPKYLWTLPKGSLRARLDRAKTRYAGDYSHAPTPNSGKGCGFYLESGDGSPMRLRWQWCDNVCTSIRHTGWFTDEFGDGEKIRGLVFRLPRSRGFLAGWSMGEGMASEVDATVYDDERSAAFAADSMAENAAEREREYQAKESERLKEEEERATAESVLAAVSAE
jgi:hypothetical protein